MGHGRAGIRDGSPKCSSQHGSGSLVCPTAMCQVCATGAVADDCSGEFLGPGRVDGVFGPVAGPDACVTMSPCAAYGRPLLWWCSWRRSRPPAARTAAGTDRLRVFSPRCASDGTMQGAPASGMYRSPRLRHCMLGSASRLDSSLTLIRVVARIIWYGLRRFLPLTIGMTVPAIDRTP